MGYKEAMGLLQGLQRGIGSYYDTVKDRERREEAESLRKEQKAFDLAKLGAQGYEVSGEGADISIAKTPEMQEQERRKMLREEAGLIPIMDKAGRLERFDKPQDASGMLKDILTREQILKAQRERQDILKKEGMQKEQSGAQARLVTENINRVLGKMNRDEFEPGLLAKMQSNIPGTEAYQVEKDLDTVRASIGFDELNKMRQSSPTGGALGQVSEREIAFLQAIAGSLDIGQGEEALGRNLNRLLQAREKIIHEGMSPEEMAGFNQQMQQERFAGPGNVRQPQQGLLQQNQSIAGPQPGAVEDGYQFMGGNPSDPSSWKRVGQ